MSQLIGGRYRLDRELAAGGFGTVWRAFDTVLRVEVAVKQVKIDPTATGAERAKLVARAEHEARNAARLRDHPHIVAVHDVVTDQGAPWLVMQLVEGRSLARELADRGRLPPPEAASIAGAVLAALAAAHDAGIVHRDVKPANIMLAEDGTVLLTDFGIAKHHTDTAQTTHGMVIGSLPYMSPERLDGHNLPAGDLFALGATLYEMTEGVTPFGRDSLTAMMTAVVLHAPEPPKNAGPLTALVLALLEKDHTRRPTAREALATVAGAAPVPDPTAVAPAPAATVAVSAAAAPAPAAVTPAAAEPDLDRRHGLTLLNELIRLASGDDARAEEAQDVLPAMARRLAHDAPRLAERVVNAVTDMETNTEARIELAAAVQQSDPQQAKRLIAGIKGLQYHFSLDAALPKLWPVDLRAAERLIGSVELFDVQKAEKLTELAVAVAAADLPNAVRIARAVPERWRAPALAGVAAVMARTDPARARDLADEAVGVAVSLAGSRERGEALAETVAEIAPFDVRHAEQIARRIAVPTTRREKRRARDDSHLDTPENLSLATALAHVASAMAAADPHRAQAIAQEAEAFDDLPDAHLALDEGIAKVGRLGHLAVAWASTDPRRAAELTARAIRVADGLGYGDDILDEFAVTVAGIRPDLTERIAAALSSQTYRDDLVAELTAAHPELAARITAASPTPASVLAAAATDPLRAAGLARAITDDGDRLSALLRLAELVAERAPELTRQLCDEAESAFLDGPGGETVLDLLVTAARAATDPNRARDLPGELAALVQALPAGASRDAALSAAASLMAGFDPHLAEVLAREIDDEDAEGAGRAVWALGAIACCLLGRVDQRTWRPATATLAFAEWVLYRAD